MTARFADSTVLRVVLIVGLVAVVRGSVAAGAGSAADAERGGSLDRIELTNGLITLGVLPSLGGRAVLLRAGDGPNLLDSDPRHWTPPFPEPSLDTPFRPWNGRILWVGPQSQFWSQQELRPSAKGAPWPPDPFNEAGRFEVVERTDRRLQLRGRTSPVTGLAFEHEFEITAERTVRMRSVARNDRSTAVAWDLWPNTRVRAEGVPYVPLDPGQPPRFDGPPPGQTDAAACAHEIRQGWLTLPPEQQPTGSRQRLWTKAFVHPSKGLIACFIGRHLLLIRSELVPRDRIHPEQAFVELYRSAGKEPILELEMHGAYQRIAPGERVSLEQTFEVLDVEGPTGPEAHLEHLKALVR